MKLLNKKVVGLTAIVGLSAVMASCASLSGEETAKPTGMGQAQAVPSVDLNRYMGKWYEVARLPMYFQRNCASDVTATYTLKANGKVEVNNQCMGKDGKPMQSIGEANKNSESGSKLKVTFLPQGLRWLPVGKADYWVLAVDDSYQYALVGTPNQKYLWLLSRMPTMPDSVYQNYVNLAKQQGYAVNKLQKTPHSVAK